MKIALLGYGKEGQAAEKYFQNKYPDAVFDIYENETPSELSQHDYSSYDLVFRSPSIPPLHLKNETSITKYFFDHCPCPIIGVTATKGKGTTCSFIKSLLDAHQEDAYLVGNIGTPAIEVLDDLKLTSIVVYEMSSFQLWDLEKSPHIAVLGTLEPDHLNVHKNYQDYLAAKAHVTKYQTATDYLIFFQNNHETTKIAAKSSAQKIPYPFPIPTEIKNSITIPGQHNQENALAAIAAVASYKNISPDEYLSTNADIIKQGLQSFKGLPHRLEFVRELGHTKYYDDNFATNPASTKVAIESFPHDNLIVIIGGRDKTNYQDLPELHEILQAPQIKQIVLIGESGHEIAQEYSDERFHLVESLKEAVETATRLGQDYQNTIVLMSPAAASFDMFKNVYDRGNQYKLLIRNL